MVQHQQQQHATQRQQQRLKQSPTTAAQATSSRAAAQPTVARPPASPRHKHRQQDPQQQQQQQQQQHGDIAFLPATPAHIAAFESIQHAAYPAELWEERHVFESILRHGCSFVAVQGATTPHAHIIGYLLIHAVADPSSPPPLNHALPPPPPASRPAHLFVHDLCLLPAFHGGGLGARFARHALARLASRAASFSCVALPHAVRFWQRQGFEAAHARPPRLPDCYPRGSQLLARPAQQRGGMG